MLNDVTVLYYTANTEDEYFSNKIRENILKNKGDLPLVSVSQKPLDFGTNICVGEQENCYHNEFRQIQIGLKTISTPYVLLAESDTLYPPSYFQFDPPERGRAYRYDNVWVHYTKFNGKPKFWFKYMSDCAQVIDKDIWLKLISSFMDKTPEWTDKEHGKVPYLQYKANDKYKWSGDPVVTFKTSLGIKSNTTTESGILPKFALPYWGGAAELRKDMFNQ